VTLRVIAPPPTPEGLRPIGLKDFFVPGTHGVFLEQEYRISMQGLRGPLYDERSPADVFRIAVAGDSIPFG